MNRTILSSAAAMPLLLLLVGCGPNGDATPNAGVSNGSSEGPLQGEERPVGTFQPGPETAIDTTVENPPTGRGTLQVPGAGSRAPLTEGAASGQQQEQPAEP